VDYNQTMALGLLSRVIQRYHIKDNLESVFLALCSCGALVQCSSYVLCSSYGCARPMAVLVLMCCARVDVQSYAARME
jgi:hypothetical protein